MSVLGQKLLNGACELDIKIFAIIVDADEIIIGFDGFLPPSFVVKLIVPTCIFVVYMTNYSIIIHIAI